MFSVVSSGTKINTFSQGVIHLSAQFMASKTSCNVTIGASEISTDELRKSSFTITLEWGSMFVLWIYLFDWFYFQ